MTFPSSNTGMTLDDGLREARNRAASLKSIASNWKSGLAAGTVTSEGILSLLNDLIGAKATLTTIAAIPGMDTYAQAQLGATISSDFTAMINAINAAGAWIIANFPASGGYMQAATLNADGTVTQRAFTSASTAQLQTLLGSLIATIS